MSQYRLDLQHVFTTAPLVPLFSSLSAFSSGHKSFEVLDFVINSRLNKSMQLQPKTREHHDSIVDSSIQRAC
jgi:hypothetical protein